MIQFIIFNFVHTIWSLSVQPKGKLGSKICKIFSGHNQDPVYSIFLKPYSEEFIIFMKLPFWNWPWKQKNLDLDMSKLIQEFTFDILSFNSQ